MEINASWSSPIKLRVDKTKNLIYDIYLDGIPSSSGCYLFYNLHGKSYSCLYIGKADDLRIRIGQQLNNLKLMMGIKKNLNGNKFLIYCTIKPNKGQQLKKALRILENNLIKTALSNGNELLNIQGTKRKYDSIIFNGNRDSIKLIGRKITVHK